VWYLNAHAWNEDKIGDSSDSFNKELEQLPHEYSVGYFNAEMGRNVSRQKVGNECEQTVDRTVGPCPLSSGQPAVTLQGQARPCW
jgi:hypothetical protein